MVRQNREQQIRNDCALIWRVLLARAIPVEPITYEELAEATGIRLSKVKNRMRLGRIHQFCNANCLGPLDVLVVLARGRIPSTGYFENRRQEANYPGDDAVIAIDCERVQNSDYTRFLDPGPEAFIPIRR